MNTHQHMAKQMRQMNYDRRFRFAALRGVGLVAGSRVTAIGGGIGGAIGGGSTGSVSRGINGS